MRRQPQPDPSHPDGSDADDGATPSVAFFFRGSFRSETRDAIEDAIGTLEQSRAGTAEQKSQWLILKVGASEPPSIAATRLADGRTFRAHTAEQLVADLQVASDDRRG